jgi:hypothetical protein
MPSPALARMNYKQAFKHATSKLKNLFTETETVELVPVCEDVNPQAAGKIQFSEVTQ